MYVDIRYSFTIVSVKIYTLYCSVCNPPVQGRLRCRIRLFLAARVFVSKCECVYLYECECLLSAWLSWYSVCLVSLLIYYGRIWVALSYYFLHFSACLMFAVVVVVLVDAVIILFCVCVCVSDWVTVRVYVWETTETQQLSLFVYAWLKTTAGFDLICQRSIRRLLWWCCFAIFLRLLWKLKSYSIAYSKKLKRKSGKGTI